MVWETGVLPARYEINVLPDRSDFEGILKSITTQLPDSQIVVTGNAETLVLTGKAKDPLQAKQAEALASTHAKKVVNLLDVPPRAEPRQILLQVRFASIDRVGLSELGFNFFSRNEKTLGSLSTQQFQQPRFSQLQFQDQAFSEYLGQLRRPAQPLRFPARPEHRRHDSRRWQRATCCRFSPSRT